VLVALTGTPGTGKNSVAEVLSRKGYYIVHLDRFAEERGLIVGFDEGRGTREVDIEALDRELRSDLAPVKETPHKATIESIERGIAIATMSSAPIPSVVRRRASADARAKRSR